MLGDKRKLAPVGPVAASDSSRRAFVLQEVQPALLGLMDGSVSTLAPIFAAAFASTKRGTLSWWVWRPRSVRESRWPLPKRSQMMAR